MPPSVTLLQRFFLAGGMAGIAGDPDLLAAVMRAAAILPGTSPDAAGVCWAFGFGGLVYQPPRPSPHPLADIACCGALPTGAAALPYPAADPTLLNVAGIFAEADVDAPGFRIEF